ncbi:CBS domain-containing protein [bacterium]|nr:CBS domain-containing protein [bacterium]
MKKLGPIVTIDKNASCGEALELMSKNHIHHLIVTENNDPIGLVSDRDVFFRWFRGNFLSRSEFEQSPVHYLVRTHLPFITEKQLCWKLANGCKNMEHRPFFQKAVKTIGGLLLKPTY